MDSTTGQKRRFIPAVMIDGLRVHWRILALGLVLLFFCDIVQILVPRVTREVFNNIQLQISGRSPGSVTPAVFAAAGLKFAGLILAVAITRMLWRMIFWPRSRRIEYEIRRDLFGHMQKLPLDFFHSNTTGDLMSRATSDLEAVRKFYSMGFVCFADAILVIPAAFIMMSLMNWRLAIAAAIPLLAGAPLSKLLMHRLHASYSASQDSLGKLTGRIEEDIAGVRALKTYAREDAALSNFETMNADYTRKAVKVSYLDAMFEPYFRLIPQVAIVTVLAWGSMLVMKGRLQLGDMAAYLMYVELMIWPTFAIGMGLNFLQRGRASAQRIQEVLDRPPQPRPPETAGPEKVSGCLSFRDLTYAHVGRSEPTIRGISLDIPAGTILGITGPTGSGKSTLLGLAAGLLTPPRGTVFLDEMDLCDIGFGPLHRAVTLVEQVPFLFSRSLADNLTYARPDTSIERVSEAVRLSALDGDAARFEKGIDTIVGERGVTLSGGQRLRAALGRALVMEPAVLLLDDVFSAVDVGTEKAIWSRIRPWSQGRTVIVVSHRVSVLRECDRVAVIEGGRLTESGPHAELIRAGGFYAGTFALQERFES